MKQQWAPQELLDHWTLTPEEMTLVKRICQTDYNRLGFSVLLKTFQREGKFPQRKQDVPSVIIEHIARQMRRQEATLNLYNWTGRTTRRHRVHIRKLLGFRIGTVADGEKIAA